MSERDYARSRRIARAAEEVRGILYGLMLILERRRSRPETLKDLTAAAGALNEVDLCYYGPTRAIPGWLRQIRVRNDKDMDTGDRVPLASTRGLAIRAQTLGPGTLCVRANCLQYGKTPAIPSQSGSTPTWPGIMFV